MEVETRKKQMADNDTGDADTKDDGGDDLNAKPPAVPLSHFLSLLNPLLLLLLLLLLVGGGGGGGALVAVVDLDAVVHLDFVVDLAVVDLGNSASVTHQLLPPTPSQDGSADDIDQKHDEEANLRQPAYDRQ
jgi:hypothetical protein